MAQLSQKWNCCQNLFSVYIQPAQDMAQPLAPMSLFMSSSDLSTNCLDLYYCHLKIPHLSFMQGCIICWMNCYNKIILHSITSAFTRKSAFAVPLQREFRFDRVKGLQGQLTFSRSFWQLEQLLANVFLLVSAQCYAGMRPVWLSVHS